MRNTVLIVDDDPIQQLFFSEQLETLGWKTLSATSTRDAMQVLSDNADSIVVVVTDIEMPGNRNGLTFANQLRFGWPDIGVMVVSGAVQPKASEMPAGVAFYHKPLPFETLLTAVDEAMRAVGRDEPVIA